jgi:hypothetical protein
MAGRQVSEAARSLGAIGNGAASAADGVTAKTVAPPGENTHVRW